MAVNLREVLDNALKERKETVEKQVDLANEFLAKGLSLYSNPEVSEVWLYHGEDGITIRTGTEEKQEIVEKYENLIYSNIVMSEIKKILESDEELKKSLKPTFKESVIRIALK